MGSPQQCIRIATRQSRLALWQAEHVAERLRAVHSDVRVELVPMTTQGDRVLDRALAEVGGKALFVKELESAMLDGRADIAVHSMKDVPTDLPEGMTIAAMLPRADPRDAFVSLRFENIDALPHGAHVGTSSPRRQSQLQHARADLKISPLRGNVETRLRKLDEGLFDAIVLATAGLQRLNLQHRITHILATERSVPAPGQGIIGIECRTDDAASLARVAALNDDEAATCCIAERALARHLQGNCHSPIAAYAALANGQLSLTGVVGSPDGRELYRDSLRGSAAEAAALGTQLAERLLTQGARQLLERLRTP